ncbi:MAG: Mfa1 family fimbria major subunit [Clostridium sp.]|nr:Mfa1 family fimbria major subunit [Prevotella sp.]MCM1429028.1 Mfa1 family fimbria major subunit [Clostridium sp.]
MFRNFLTYLIVAFILASCSEVHEEPACTEYEVGGQCIRISLKMPLTGSRAESHTNEDALENECIVKNITLLIYTGASGLDSPADTQIMDSYYFTSADSGFTQTGAEVEIAFNSGNYHISPGDRVLALINMGDCSSFKTLGQVQDFIPSQAWTVSASLAGCRNFTMANANANDGVVVPLYPENTDAEYGTKENPLTATLEVERTAARIDFDYTGGEPLDDFIVYPARLADGSKVATVYVSHVLPVNAMQQSSYALKRISVDATDSYDCFSSYRFAGTLPKDESGRPTAYVVEPHSTLKELPLSNFEAFYGNTSSQTIKTFGHDYFTQANKLKLNLDDSRINFPSKKSIILAYANENTQHVNNHYAECLTGLVIRAQYVPEVIYTNADLSAKIANPARGTDIWRYTPQNSTTTEADIKYFASQEAALEYSSKHVSDKAEIKSFPQGICYYNLWIRHTVFADGKRPEGTVFPMEYGIVRNHIYRVAISFRGIGREGVTIEDPWNVEPEIYVRPWNMRRQPQIIM